MKKEMILLLSIFSLTVAGPGIGLRFSGNAKLTGNQTTAELSGIPSVLLGDSIRYWEIGIPVGFQRNVLSLEDYKTRTDLFLIGVDINYLRTLFRSQIFNLSWGGEFLGQYSLPPKVIESSPSKRVVYKETDYLIGNIEIDLIVQGTIKINRYFSLALRQSIVELSGECYITGISPEAKIYAYFGIPKSLSPSIQIIYNIKNR